MLGDLRISLLSYDRPVFVGAIHDDGSDGSRFAYDATYLTRPDAIPLSFSLPLRAEPFTASEYLPYFEGLLAEGMARRALAAELQLAENDTLAFLASCGRDCIGDVVVEQQEDEPISETLAYEPVSPDELNRMFRSVSETAGENAASRLSLAGTQGKTGLAHDPRLPIEKGWLRPRGLAATTHILKTSYLHDLPEIEYLCMHAAAACGLDVANTHLLDCGAPVLAVERFDRSVRMEGGKLRVERLHQEDLAQAFGMMPGSKYADLPGGSVRAIAGFLKKHSLKPARDLAEFCRILLFSYLIGNCDGHLKNYSIRLFPNPNGDNPFVFLTCAYDLVSTTRYPRFSRDMAIAIGGVRDIDAVGVDTLEVLAAELGMKRGALQRLARPMVDSVEGAISRAGSGKEGAVLASTPYVADDLVEEMQPRLKVLREFYLH